MPWLKPCPSCGKRFGVVNMGRELVDTQSETEETTCAVLVRMGSGRNAGGGNPVTTPVTVNLVRETFETRFSCSKCGRRWTERTNTITKG